MRFKKWVDEQTTTGAIALNLTKGNVDVVGADCPEGKVKTRKGLCVDKVKPKTKLTKEFVSEAYTFKKGDTVTWKAPDKTGMKGTVITGEIRGKLKVMPEGGKKAVLVPVKGAANVSQLKKKMKSGSKAMTHPDIAESSFRQYLSEYDETHREDIYQDLAKEIMKKHKGKKVIPAQVVQDAVVGHWAGDAPYDKYDYQEIADILKKKGIKLKGGIR